MLLRTIRLLFTTTLGRNSSRNTIVNKVNRAPMGSRAQQRFYASGPAASFDKADKKASKGGDMQSDRPTMFAADKEEAVDPECEIEVHNHYQSSGLKNTMPFNPPNPLLLNDRDPEKAEKEAIETELELRMGRQLATNFLILDQGTTMELRVTLGLDRKGLKHFSISKLGKVFSHIYVPNDACEVLGAIDKLLAILPAQQPPDPEAAIRAELAAKVKRFMTYHSVLDSQQVEGTVHNFLLAIACCQGRWEMHLHSLWKIDNKDPHAPNERTIFLPLWAAPWLRQQMAEMLAKDGEEKVEGRIGPMPAVPEWVEQLRTNRTTTTQTETKTVENTE